MTEETLEKLAQLLEQDQFELLIPEKIRTESGRISDNASLNLHMQMPVHQVTRKMQVWKI